MRIASLLPSATEILFALGLGDDVVGVTHECAYPPEALSKPRLVTSRIDHEQLDSEAIHRFVTDCLRRHESLYRVDVAMLQRLRPDLVVTQELCEVCAVDAKDVLAAVRTLSPPPCIVSLHPHTLREALSDILVVGRATERVAQAQQLVAELDARAARVQRLGQTVQVRPRVFCLEWLDPPMASGHWVPELVELAGGREVLGEAGQPSRVVNWSEIVAAQPEIIVVMPCGFPIARTARELPLLERQPEWPQLPAVRSGRVYLVNGPAYFNQSGPRSIDGLELLARLIHVERLDELPQEDARRWPGLA